MPAPRVYPFPIKRPGGFLLGARFAGPDETLTLEVDYPDGLGNLQTVSFRCTALGPNDPQEVCIPNAAWDVTKIHRDALVASIRMASIVSGTIAGSQEWLDALQKVTDPLLGTPGDRWFQLACGQVKVKSVSYPDDSCIAVEFQRGTTADVVTHDIGLTEINAVSYVYAPSTQLLVIPGAIEKGAPANSWEHDYPSDPLTTAERDAIVTYVLGLKPWV
jgi:hypothetical protein